MISTRIPTNVLMGKPVVDNTYNRFSITCNDKRTESILKYNAGVHCVFSSNTKTLNIKYRVHFNGIAFFMSKKLRTEIECMGLRYDGKWEMLNIVSSFHKHEDFQSDECIQIQIPLRERKYKEFQLCFPPGGRVTSVIIETDDTPKFKVLPNTIMFLGSSIAQDSNTSAHTNLCCYLYRHYNINACTLAVSGSHSFLCPELIQYVKKNQNDRKLILVDLVHLTNNDYTNFIKHVPVERMSYAVLSNTARKEVFDIAKNNKEIRLIDIPGDAMYDEVHLNALGTYMYVTELEKLGFWENTNNI